MKVMKLCEAATELDGHDHETPVVAFYALELSGSKLTNCSGFGGGSLHYNFNYLPISVLYENGGPCVWPNCLKVHRMTKDRSSSELPRPRSELIELRKE